ncbi:ABC transporter substrate-binding protein [Pseudarthrobacter sp. DSP2-3-2b1]|uniref:ABC transporter substrate-binding protein n=1 Tax=Pseudarthrobacter sp. DSP2-3-2b1 TaxID=2804661 RepID=UPI003CEA99C8
MTQEVIGAFQTDFPDITITPEMGSFDGYFDKLATQTAAGNAPDIIQMPDGFFTEYLGRGALLDLTKLNIDHSNIADAVWNTGTSEGKLYGVPSGVNTHCVVANPKLFEAAGVAIPDDNTWTWDDYARISSELSEKLGDGKFGSAAFGLDQNGLAIWLRQHGSELFTADGKLGIDPAQLADFWKLLKKMSDDGAIPPAGTVTEETGIALEQSGTATGRYALGWWASNQLSNLNKVSGVELKLLKPPTVAGKASEGKFAIGTGWYVASAKTKHPEQVAKFMDFMVNNQKAGDILLTERGAPANSKTRQNLVDSGRLTKADTDSIAFLDELSKIALNPPPASPPVGAGSFQDILRRYSQDVLFGKRGADDAAKDLISEANSEIK